MFAVCGEALFDVFAAEETPTGLLLDARIGGSPFNVAVGLCRLGQPASLVTRISDGFLGERLMRALKAEGVDTGAVQRGSQPTTLSLVGLDARGVPSYAFYGEGCADRALDASVFSAWPSDVRCVHFGSYATVVGATAQTQRTIVERVKGQCLISYDPNVRLNVEPDLQRWRDQVDWMLTRTHLLKVSQEDLELLYGGASEASFIQRALDGGVGLLVITRGHEGAQAWTQHRSHTMPPQVVEVVDTVGAGDTFQCALLTWLAENGRLDASSVAALGAHELDVLLRFACQAAALTCSRRGADLPRRHELNG